MLATVVATIAPAAEIFVSAIVRGTPGQQASVELTPQALEWLNEKLERAFEQHGRIPPDVLEDLDWPATPGA